MADITIRKLDDWVADHFRARARRAGRSLEEELRRELTEAALRVRREFAAESRNIRADLKNKYGVFSDSAELIREDREARG